MLVVINSRNGLTPVTLCLWLLFSKNKFQNQKWYESKTYYRSYKVSYIVSTRKSVIKQL